MQNRFIIFVSSFIFSSLIVLPAQADSLKMPASVFMENMTWMEIRDRMKAGATTAIVPTGGVEQNGPQMITNKHNIIARYTAGEIAKKLGNALVVPVIVTVPEGRIDPPEGHMNFPGTLSVSDDTFAAILRDTAASLKQHGFRTICFIGEHGGSQDVQRRVAENLNQQWQGGGVQVIHVSDYYYRNGQSQWVDSVGLKIPDPSAHAGFEDTSELMALYAPGVRDSLRGKRTEHDFQSTGSAGDSSQASAKYGNQLLQLKVDAAVRQIANTISRTQ